MSRSMIHVFRFVAALVLLLCAVGQAKANHVIDNSAFQTTIISLGEQDGLPFAESAYFAQTFVSPGGVAKDLTIFIETGSPLPGEVLDDTKFHLLLTGFSGLHPTDVLFESGTIDVAPGGKFPPMPLTIGLANTPLGIGRE